MCLRCLPLFLLSAPCPHLPPVLNLLPSAGLSLLITLGCLLVLILPCIHVPLSPQLPPPSVVGSLAWVAVGALDEGLEELCRRQRAWIDPRLAVKTRELNTTAQNQSRLAPELSSVRLEFCGSFYKLLSSQSSMSASICIALNWQKLPVSSPAFRPM